MPPITRKRARTSRASLLDHLPTDLIDHVLSYLSAPDLARAAPTCHAVLGQVPAVVQQRLDDAKLQSVDRAPNVRPLRHLLWRLYCTEHEACSAWRCAFDEGTNYLGLWHKASGCAILMSALNRDHLVMPALERILFERGGATSLTMRTALREALLARERARRQRCLDISGAVS